MRLQRKPGGGRSLVTVATSFFVSETQTVDGESDFGAEVNRLRIGGREEEAGGRKV